MNAQGADSTRQYPLTDFNGNEVQVLGIRQFQYGEWHTKAKFHAVKKWIDVIGVDHLPKLGFHF